MIFERRRKRGTGQCRGMELQVRHEVLRRGHATPSLGTEASLSQVTLASNWCQQLIRNGHNGCEVALGSLAGKWNNGYLLEGIKTPFSSGGVMLAPTRRLSQLPPRQVRSRKGGLGGQAIIVREHVAAIPAGALQVDLAKSHVEQKQFRSSRML